MPLAYAILAFLNIQPMSGYDLKKFFDISIAHFWSSTQSHIYKALDELERRGLVEVHLIAQAGRPNRKEYHITDAGRADLRAWLTTPLTPDPIRTAWLIQIFFAYQLDNQQIVDLLEARAAALRERLAVYQSEAQAAIDSYANDGTPERARQLWQFTLDYGINLSRAELEWLEQMQERARNLPPLPPRGQANDE